MLTIKQGNIDAEPIKLAQQNFSTTYNKMQISNPETMQTIKQDNTDVEFF